MKIKLLPLSQLKPYDRNPRIHGRSIEATAASIQKFGFRQPLVVDRDFVIVVGHGRFFAAQQLKLARVPVHVATDLTADQVRAYRIADNKTGELSDWDLQLLGLELLDLKANAFDLTTLGFDDAALAELLDDQSEGPTDPDFIPAAPAKPKTRPGDIWILGEHRLLCGDSTQSADVARLMDGSLADMVFTDPPYGVAVTGGTRDRRNSNFGNGLKIANDDLPDGALHQFLSEALTRCAEVMAKGASIYVFHADSKGRIFREAFESRFLLHQVLIWAKQEFVFGRSDYHWQHEPILYGWLEGAKHQFFGEHNQGTVWQFDRPSVSHDHPTMKPVCIAVKAIQNSSKPGNLIFEPFGGSGSTLMAAQLLGRRCYTIELDPRYCDVIVERWEKFTGKKAVRQSTHQTESRRCSKTKSKRSSKTSISRKGKSLQAV